MFVSRYKYAHCLIAAEAELKILNPQSNPQFMYPCAA
jgi:hypothetical protein